MTSSAWVDTSGARSGPAPGTTQRAWSQGPRGSEGWGLLFSVLVREQCRSALGRLVIKAGACRLGSLDSSARDLFPPYLILLQDFRLSILQSTNPPSPSVGFISVDAQGLADAVRVPCLFLSLFPSWRFACFRFIVFCCGDGAYALDGRERRPLQNPLSIYTQPCSAFLLSCPRGRRGIPAAARPGPSLAGERRSLRLPMAWPRSTPRRRIWGPSGFSEKPFGLRRWTSSATKQPESSNLFAVCEFLFFFSLFFFYC